MPLQQRSGQLIIPGIRPAPASRVPLQGPRLFVNQLGWSLRLEPELSSTPIEQYLTRPALHGRIHRYGNTPQIPCLLKEIQALFT
jgi:hypothetical protein